MVTPTLFAGLKLLIGELMIKSSSRRVAVVLSGTALALTAATLPAQAATTGWRVNSVFAAARGSESAVTNVDAVSARDAWTAGFTLNSRSIQSVLRHWTGKSWRRVTLPTAIAKSWNASFPIFSPVAASSASNVWVFTSFPGGRYLHLNGKRWSLGSLPGAGTVAGPGLEIMAASDLGKNNAWAFGAKINLSRPTPTSVPYAAHFNGSKWKGQTLPGKGVITAVSVTSSRSMWAVVGSPNAVVSPGSAQGASKPVVLHWTPSGGWQRAAVQPALPVGANLTSVQAGPGGTVWIGGSVRNSAKGTTAFAAKWTTAASAWALARLGGASAGKWELTDMASDGRGGIWGIAVAKNVKGEPERMWHLSGATWSKVTPGFGKREWILTQLATVPGTASVWGVGALKAGTSGNALIAIDGPTPR
jgi:hypothetical protein